MHFLRFQVFIWPEGHISIKGPSTWGNIEKTEPILVIDGVIIDLENAESNNSEKKLLMESPLLTYIKSYPPGAVDFIEVLTGAEAAYYGARGGNGAIIINTRNGPRKIIKNSIPGLKQFFTKGYLNPILFVGPDYDKPEVKNSANPDLRSTLYWDGDLLTDENGKASIDFFTSDAATTYSVIVRGVTVSGDIIYKKITIQRK